MRGQLGGALAGLTLALALVAPAAAQQWPAYGAYGYGAGYDYTRNAYSYPRPIISQTTAMPEESVALYGGYMPLLYYSGAVYPLNRASTFESGQAYCQTAGSYLYCADVGSGSAVALLSAEGRAQTLTAFMPPPSRMGSDAVYQGVLSTRTLGNTQSLAGTLRSSDGAELAVNCSGPASGDTASLTCR
ncbi:MAG TPA: hypothetical protein VFE37_07065 [Chloroflexota bacterium]|nr:hypothetical protein [Chloroflexota bacterium]